MSESVFDAVVIGAGPNGLVAANALLDKGWSVLVLEAQPEVGGAVRSDDHVHPGFVHDTFSAFYPLAAASPAIEGFDLGPHGLRWVHAPAVVAHPARTAPGRSCTVTVRSPPGSWTSSTPATVPPGSTCARSGTGSATHW
jgi:phytoene dehydrogenase-like protein